MQDDEVNQEDGVESGSEESTSSEESEDDDLVLEGVVMRNPEVPSSDEDSEDDDEKDTKPRSKEKRKESVHEQLGKKKRKKNADDEDLQVEFLFCDMDEKFFHGVKSLLNNSSTIYQAHASSLVDLMISNVQVGTVVSTEGDEDGNVFGFASVLNVTSYQDAPAIQHLKEVCLSNCPKKHKEELEVVLSGKTKRPAGFLIHGRMVNLPLEIVDVLHDQLVVDMDWAVNNAEPEDRKSFDFGAFVVLAPCQKEGGSMVYRYFDDEIFADRAEFVFTLDAPKSYSKEEKQYINVIVLTKTGHRDAMNDLKKMIHGAIPVQS
jgi:protein BCP1